MTEPNSTKPKKFVRLTPMPPKGSEITKESNTLALSGLQPAPKSVYDYRVYYKTIALIKKMQAEYNTPEKIKEFKGFPPITFMAGELVPNQNKHVGGYILDEVHASCKRLIQSYFRKYISPKHCKFFSAYSYIEYDNGLVTFQINNDMAPELLGVEDNYFLTYTEEISKIDSVHAVQLYRAVMSQAAFRRDFSITLTELYNIFGATKAYTNEKGYGSFKRMIKKAIIVLNDKISALKNLTFEENKIGKKVVGLHFYPFGLPNGAQKTTITVHDYQKESRECYIKHDGGECKPRRCKKCQFCYERGSRSFQTPPEWLFKDKQKTAD